MGELHGQLGPVPHLHAPLLEEALVDLQGVLRRPGGDVGGRVVIQGFHVLDVDDPSFGSDKRYGERYEGVLHREGERQLSLEDEEHAPVFGQRGAVHEPSSDLKGVVGDLDPHPHFLAARGVDGHGAKLRDLRGLCGLRGRPPLRDRRLPGQILRPRRTCTRALRSITAADEQEGEQEQEAENPHRRTNSMRLFWRPLLLWPVISIRPTSRVLATWVPPSAWVSRPSISTTRITPTRSGTRLTWVRMRSGFSRASSRGSP